MLLCSVDGGNLCVSMANQLSEASDPLAKGSGRPARTIVQEVVTQHAEETSFLWLLRHAAVSQPHYSLQDLSKLDNRLEAHLDGLRIAGESGWNVVQETLPFEESSDCSRQDHLRSNQVISIGLTLCWNQQPKSPS
jgi:hypothetical protein